MGQTVIIKRKIIVAIPLVEEWDRQNYIKACRDIDAEFLSNLVPDSYYVSGGEEIFLEKKNFFIAYFFYSVSLEDTVTVEDHDQRMTNILIDYIQTLPIFANVGYIEGDNYASN